MDALNMVYRLKKRFGPPGRYLGLNVENVQLNNVRVVYSTNCVDYLKSAIENVDNSLGVYNTTLNSNVDSHRQYSSSFRTELYFTE